MRLRRPGSSQLSCHNFASHFRVPRSRAKWDLESEPIGDFTQTKEAAH